MSNILPFNFEQQAVRVVTREGQPWFVLADLCEVLEIANVGNAAARLKDTEKDNIRLTDAIGRSQRIVVASEAGFYRLVLRSDKPQAEKFQSWVTGEVLPSIRRTGGYMVSAPDETPEELMARALRVAQDAIERQKAQLAIAAPKAAALDLLMDASGTLTLPAAAKVLEIAPSELPEWLDSHAWTYKRGGDRFARQEKLNAGLLVQKSDTITLKDGSPKLVSWVRVTAKGMAKLAAIFGKSIEA